MRNRLDLAATDTELVTLFSEAAVRNGDAADASDYRNANRQHDAALSITRELKRRGRASHEKLLPLLTNTNPWIRYWAAAMTLEFAAADAEQVLEAIVAARVSPTLTLNAELILNAWRQGSLEVV